ncbi:MAG: corrinoid protein [Syntrophobacteraceae bacterium]|nr:corrinoid protein [Syntrophobacteraceae bacterium]
MSIELERIREAVVLGNRDLTATLVRKALGAGLPPGAIMSEALIAGMDVVGQKYSTGEYFLPEMMVAALAMEEALSLLRPHLAQGNYRPRARAIIGTVQADIHDIGKNIVKMMMEGAGYEVVDLGVDVSPEAFLEAVRRQLPRFVLISSLITLTMENMKKTVEAISASDLRENVLIGVGGAPVTKEFADRIGADFYADDARGCVLNCNRLTL